MSNCKDCIHSVFDEVWGEYKCKFYTHRIYNPEQIQNCPEYKKDQNKNTPKG